MVYSSAKFFSLVAGLGDPEVRFYAYHWCMIRNAQIENEFENSYFFSTDEITQSNFDIAFDSVPLVYWQQLADKFFELCLILTSEIDSSIPSISLPLVIRNTQDCSGLKNIRFLWNIYWGLHTVGMLKLV